MTAQGARNRELEHELKAYRSGSAPANGSASPSQGDDKKSMQPVQMRTPSSNGSPKELVSEGDDGHLDGEEGEIGSMMLHDEASRGYGGFGGFGMLPSMPETGEDGEGDDDGMEGVEGYDHHKGLGMGMSVSPGTSEEDGMGMTRKEEQNLRERGRSRGKKVGAGRKGLKEEGEEMET